MSLDRLNEKLAGIRERARLEHEKVALDARALSSDPNLSMDGRRAILQESKIAARGELDRVRAEEQAAIAAELDRLERAVFGQAPTDSSGLIAYRDAQERARSLPPTEEGGPAAALSYLDQARISGDETLAAAIVKTSIERGWRNVPEAYREQFPAKGALLEDLVTLLSWASSATTRMEMSMVYSTPEPGLL